MSARPRTRAYFPRMKIRGARRKRADKYFRALMADTSPWVAVTSRRGAFQPAAFAVGEFMILGELDGPIDFSPTTEPEEAGT